MVASPDATLCLLLADLPVIMVSRIRAGPSTARAVVAGKFGILGRGTSMISRKTLAGLMVGASVSALFLAASPVMAVELEGDHGAGPVVCTQEFGVNHIPDLEISDDFV